MEFEETALQARNNSIVDTDFPQKSISRRASNNEEPPKAEDLNNNTINDEETEAELMGEPPANNRGFIK